MSTKSNRDNKKEELEKKLQLLQDEKEILNPAIDIADATMHTDIKKVFELVVRKYKRVADSKPEA